MARSKYGPLEIISIATTTHHAAQPIVHAHFFEGAPLNLNPFRNRQHDHLSKVSLNPGKPEPVYEPSDAFAFPVLNPPHRPRRWKAATSA